MQLDHPAISAWCELQPAYAVPKHIDVIKEESRKTTVYRLVFAGKAGLNIIAKRSLRATAKIEHTVYEEILPNLPFPTLQYYGSVEELNGEFWWLFLEDVSGEKKYLPHIREHRVAAAQWMGIMNTFASRLEPMTHLPERGSNHYLTLLHTACDTLKANVTNPALNAPDLRLIESVLTQCDYLSSQWDQLAATCEGAPQTLVHGDFITNNVKIRYGRDRIIILPFDWEKAGWGIPAEDISRVDIPTYWATIHDSWPRFTIQYLKKLSSVGRIFRCLVFLDWIAPSLSLGMVQQPINDIRSCQTWLTDLIKAAGLQD